MRSSNIRTSQSPAGVPTLRLVSEGSKISMEPVAERHIATSDQPATLPYLSGPLLERLSISTAELMESIEQLILGQRRGQVWCAPKAVVLPGDERYIMATLAVADEPRIVATKSLVLNPRNPGRGLTAINSLVT